MKTKTRFAWKQSLRVNLAIIAIPVALQNMLTINRQHDRHHDDRAAVAKTTVGARWALLPVFLR